MRKLAVNLIVGLGILVVLGGLFQYWYSHNHVVFKNSLEIIQSDQSVVALLGNDIEASSFVHIKVSEKYGGADVSYFVGGDKAQAEAKVSAFLKDKEWKFKWIWLKLENGKYHTVLDNRHKKQR